MTDDLLATASPVHVAVSDKLANPPRILFQAREDLAPGLVFASSAICGTNLAFNPRRFTSFPTRMKRLISALAVSLSLSAHGAIINSVDGTFLTDTTSGLDWLDVTLTENRSYNDVRAQLNSNGQFAGWRYATGAEFNRLISNFTGVAIADQNYGQVMLVSAPTRIDGLVELLGSTVDAKLLREQGKTYDTYYNLTNGNSWRDTFGILGDAYTGVSQRVARILDYDSATLTGFDHSEAYFSTVPLGSPVAGIGSFLVRDTLGPSRSAVVPEPDSVPLILAGLGWMGWVMRRQQSKKI